MHFLQAALIDGNMHFYEKPMLKMIRRPSMS